MVRPVVRYMVGGIEYEPWGVPVEKAETREESTIAGLRDALRTVLENKPDRANAKEILRRIAEHSTCQHSRAAAKEYLDRPEACQ